MLVPRLLGLILVVGLTACAPSPLFTGTRKQALAPGPVPRDGNGRPVLSAAKPPPTIPVQVINTPPTPAAAVIFFSDLDYSNHSARR
jgi:hypothetical protein